ncbi:MAG: fibronectin type III domain-containing protein [Anaerolineales bacterium]
MKTKFFHLLIALVLVMGWVAGMPATQAHADPAVLYAAPATAGNGTCSSWANACTLQAALANATGGDEIWVKEGLYKPGASSTDSFTMKDSVEVFGGFAGTETDLDERDWHTHVTVLSGDIDNNDITDGNGIVLNVNNIKGTNSDHVVTIDTVASVVLDGFVITAGQGVFHGGGIFIRGCVPEISNVILSGNFAADGGGGILTDTGLPELTNVVFFGNNGGEYGGGMYNYNSNPLLINVTFDSNSASYGSGIYNAYSNLTAENTILWGDGSAAQEIYNDTYSTPSISYSDVEESGYIGGASHNIYADPLFTDAADGNLIPQAGSPVINAGNNAYLPDWLTTDLDDNLRIYGPAVDMGAYEVQPAPKAPKAPSAPSLTSPANNALETSATPSLSWSKSSLTSSAFGSYQVEVTTNAGFTSLAGSASITSPTDHSWVVEPALTPNTKYYWRVQTCNNTGQCSAWAKAHTFRVALPAPTSLQANGSVHDLRPSLTWSMPAYPAPAATRYTVEFSTNRTSFAPLVQTGTATSMSYIPSINLPSNKTLYWRVRANGLNGPSAWSAPGTYVTDNPSGATTLAALE